MENNTIFESDEILPSSNSNEANILLVIFKEQSQQSDQITDESNETEQLLVKI